jgi:hypothetical protein
MIRHYKKNTLFCGLNIYTYTAAKGSIGDW